MPAPSVMVSLSSTWAKRLINASRQSGSAIGDGASEERYKVQAVVLGGVLAGATLQPLQPVHGHDDGLYHCPRSLYCMALGIAHEVGACKYRHGPHDGMALQLH